MTDNATLYRMYQERVQTLQHEEHTEGARLDAEIHALSERLAVLDPVDNIVEYRNTKLDLRELQKKRDALCAEASEFNQQTAASMMHFMQLDQRPKKIRNGLDALSRKGPEQADITTRQRLYRELRTVLDPSYSSKPTASVSDEAYCFDCRQFRELIDGDAVMVCQGCGTQRSIAETAVRATSQEVGQSKSKSNEYQRFSHFCARLDDIQGMAKATVPDHVLELVRKEILRERMSDKLDLLEERDIKRYLRKHRKKGYDKYYDNCTQILYQITNKPPLQFTSEQKRNLEVLFMAIQEPFELYKPEGSHNFAHYSTIIYRFCQLLGYNEFLPKLKLHKDEKVRKEHDALWFKICEHMGGEEKGWKFFNWSHT